MDVENVDDTMPAEHEPEAKLDVPAALQLILDNQKIIMDNQAILAKEIYDVKAGIREIYRQLPSSGNPSEVFDNTLLMTQQ